MTLLTEDLYCPPSNFRIVSGGQTGADRTGLDWALAHGVSHGGWCPKGRRREDGQVPDHYVLQETPSASYLQRTEWNVRDSDATVVFTLQDKLEGGSKRTVEFAERHSRPCLHMRPGVHPKFLASFLSRHGVVTLNVAGSRESSAPGIAEFVQQALSASVAVGPDPRQIEAAL